MISAKNCRGRIAGRGVGVEPRSARGDVLSRANADILARVDWTTCPAIYPASLKTCELESTASPPLPQRDIRTYISNTGELASAGRKCWARGRVYGASRWC